MSQQLANTVEQPVVQRRSRALMVAAAIVIVAIGILLVLAGGVSGVISFLQNGFATAKVDKSKLSAGRAKRYLDQICKIGKRVSGTEGMAKQQKLLADHFREHGAEVNLQKFDLPHPVTGRPTRFGNLIVTWHPKAKKRILIACHYDTRPYPDRDLRDPKGLFIGANDGASGVALLMEMAHHMKTAKTKYGVDFIFFDGEELIYADPNRRKETDKTENYFLGSKHFAKTYRDQPPEHTYVAGVVVDMVGDRNLRIYMEINSLRYAPTVTRSIWKAASDIGVREFVRRQKHEVTDDHIPLNTIARIPTCDIIDFDYPHWHTTKDVPAKCSGTSLVKVGRVLMKWMQNPPAP